MSIKLSSEELAEVNQLQQDYAQTKLNIGDIATKIAEVEDKLAALESEKFDNIETYKVLVLRDKDLSTKLQQKYGRGIIDMSTGEITLG